MARVAPPTATALHFLQWEKRAGVNTRTTQRLKSYYNILQQNSQAAKQFCNSNNFNLTAFTIDIFSKSTCFLRVWALVGDYSWLLGEDRHTSVSFSLAFLIWFGEFAPNTSLTGYRFALSSQRKVESIFLYSPRSSLDYWSLSNHNYRVEAAGLFPASYDKGTQPDITGQGQLRVEPISILLS
jgi:hypothetical protein